MVIQGRLLLLEIQGKSVQSQIPMLLSCRMYVDFNDTEKEILLSAPSQSHCSISLFPHLNRNIVWCNIHVMDAFMQFNAAI